MDMYISNEESPGYIYEDIRKILLRASTESEKSERGIYYYKNDDEYVFVSYKNIYRKANKIVGGLRKIGIHPGKKIILQLEKNEEFVYGLWACIIGGYVPVIVNFVNFYNKDSQELVRLLNVCRKFPDAAILSAGSTWSRITKLCKTIDNTCILFESIEECEYTSDSDNSDCERDVMLLFSSGSTGNPKGIMLKNKNLCCSLAQTYGFSGMSETDVAVNWMPLSHVAGLVVMHLTSTYACCNQVLISTNTFIEEPQTFIDAITQYKGTISMLPNFALNHLIQNKNEMNLSESDLSALKIIWTGTEPIYSETIHRFYQEYFQYGLRKSTIHTFFGMTEAACMITMQKKDEIVTELKIDSTKYLTGHIVKSNHAANSISFISSGYPAPGVSIRIVSDDGTIAQENQTGEIRIKGDNVIDRYYNNYSDIVDKEGFLGTGDIGFIHEGQLYVIGRKKNMIIINGQNYYAEDIESVCEKNQKNCKCIACGITNQNSQREDIVIFIEIGTNAEYESVVDEIRRKMARAIGQTIKEIVPVQKLSYTASGKKQRNKMMEEYQTYFRSGKSGGEKVMNELQKKIYRIWNEITGCGEISIKDHFSYVGGDSIALIKVVSKLNREFGIRISPTEFDELGTIENISAYIEERANVGEKHTKDIAVEPDEILEDGSAFPLTLVQAAYLTGRNREFTLGGMDTHIYYQVKTNIDIKRFEKCINRLVSVQPMLRAVVSANGTQRILSRVPDYKITVEDISAESQKIQNERLQEMKKNVATNMFEVDKWPMFDIKAVKTSNELYLFFDFDLMIMDGGSIHIFMKQLSDLYNGNTDINEAISFRNYIGYLEKIRNSELYTTSKEYWQQLIADVSQAPSLPMLCEVEKIATLESRRVSKLISLNTWEKLEQVARKHKISMSVLLLTIYADILSVWSGQEHFAINVTLFNRPVDRKYEQVIGDFTSLVLLSVDFSGKTDFWDKAESIRKTLLQALNHRYYDGIEVVREITQMQEEQYLAPVVFTSMLLPDEISGTIDQFGEVVFGGSQTSQVYLDFQITRLREGILLSWDYMEQLFENELVKEMFKAYNDCIAQVESEGTVNRVRISNEDIKFIERYNQSDKEIPVMTISEAFEKSAALYTDKIAIKDSQHEITYTELDKMSNQVAAYLRLNGVISNQVVAVLGERKIETIINIIGILKAGAAYVAIDPEYPEERKNYIQEFSGSKILLDCNSYQNMQMSVYPDFKINIPQVPSNLAYVIYTSGSTGRPKGVMVSHEAVMNTLLDINERYAITKDDTIIGISSMSFDLSVYDIFGSLLAGATLVQIPDLHNVNNIVHILKEEHVTVWNSVPAIMEMLVDNINSSKKDETFMEVGRETNINLSNDAFYLRLIMLSGDWIPLALPDKIKSIFDDSMVISLGGATEAAIWSIYFPIDKVEPNWKSIPYGYPLSNQKMYILTSNQDLAPVNVQGEIYIGGKGVADGYQNELDKTAAAFIKHKELGYIYRTGDYGVLRRDGYIEFLGRKDQQVKISGHRIELGEIENVLNQSPLVSNSTVIVREDIPGRKYLCAYYVAESEISEEELRSEIARSLPDYMVPKYYVRIDEIPLTANGKINKKALPALGYVYEQEYVEEKTATEHKLAEIWKKVIGIERISVVDSFLRLGGDSIMAVNTITKINDIFGINLSYREFMNLKNIRAIGELIDLRKPEFVDRYKKINGNTKNRYEKFPLTDVQIAYLMGRDEKYSLGGIATHAYYEIETQLSIQQLESALNQLIEQQEMLRAVFTGDGMQKILPSVPAYKINIIDVSSAMGKEKEEILLQTRNQMSHHIFDPEQWPLFEIKAIKADSNSHRLLIGFDLLIMDGASLQIFVQQWLLNYYGYGTVQQRDFTFRDYCLALKDLKKSKIYEDDKKYWLGKVRDFANPPMLPYKKGSMIKEPRFQRYEKQIDGQTWNKLKKIAQKRDVTPTTILCTIYSIVLSYWSNQKRLAINTTVFTRYPFNEAVKNMIGDFTAVMLLDIQILEKNFWSNVEYVQGIMTEAFEHRHYDGIEFIRNLSQENGDGEQVLMPIVFTSMLSSDSARGKLSDLGTLVYSVSQTSQVYLDYQVMEMGDGILITWDFIEEIFPEELIEAMFRQYMEILYQVSNEQKCEPTIIDQTEEIFNQYNKTEKDLSLTTIQEAFYSIVQRHPQNIAVKFGKKNLTYTELNEKSNQIANYLISAGIEKGDHIGVLGVRVPDTIVNIMGILKARASYVAIDPEYPNERRSYILNHSNCKMLLIPETYEKEKVKLYSKLNPDIEYNLDDIAYIIYTSGSTGKPKGVVITNGAAMNTVLDINMRFNVNEKDQIIGISSLCFDLSVYDVFGSLAAGATLVQIPDIRDIRSICKIVKEEGITIWNSVPAIMDMLVENMELQSAEETSFWQMLGDEEVKVLEDSLRLVMLSGDWIPLALPDKIKQYFNECEVISLGGATEASIWSIYYPIEKIEEDWKSIPYGYPLANQTFYVMNYSGELCPIGVPGELYIGGKGVALEYKNDVEKTKEAFVENSKYGRLYKTGDFGVMNAKGYIEFLGRKDHQVKIGGHRIELGEIENCILSFHSIQNVVVIDREDINRHKYLCAYIVENDKVSDAELQGHLMTYLPEYMIPQYILRINEIPLTANGKVDRKALPLPDTSVNKKNYVAPSNDIEKKLAEIWTKVLGIEEISADDSFLRIGGDSILMVNVIGKVEDVFGVKITYREFMNAKTIKKLGEIISGREASENRSIKYQQYKADESLMYERFPLTDVQMAYLMGRDSGFELGNISTHGYYEIETTLDLEKFNESLNYTIASQPMLRAIVLKSGEQQILEEVPQYKMAVLDLRGKSPEKQQSYIIKERERMSHHVFDTEQWPLFEIKAFRITDEISYLFLGIDLLIADGSSMRIFIKSLMDFYKGAPINKIGKFSFRDYILALNEFKKGDVYKEDENYWLNKLAEFPEAPALPLKCQVAEVADPHFERCQKTLGWKEWNTLQNIAKERDITPSVLLCTIFSRVLGFWSNQKEHALNITVFTRYPFSDNVNKLIGDFTSVILLDVELQPNENIWKSAANIQSKLMEAFEHRHYDGINFIRELAKNRERQQQAIMPVVFTSMLFSMEEDENNASFTDLGNIKMGVSQTSQVYLDYQVMETSEGLSISWDYVKELFDQEMMQTMFDQNIDMLRSIAGEKVILPCADTKTVAAVSTYNTSDVDIPETTLQEQFERIVALYPDKTAVKDGEGQLSFSELEEKANQVAAFLKDKGFINNEYIAIIAHRKKETIINILGILKAGCAYVPIDPAYPDERKEYIIKDSGCAMTLDIDSYVSCHMYKYPTEKICDGRPEDKAYIIYTSGSTGRPKGVVISQKAVMNTVIDINNKFQIRSNDVIIGLSSMCFDLSVYDIFGALTTGATLVQIRNIHDVNYIVDVINEEGVTIWNSVPAVIDMVVQARIFKNDTIRLVMLSGDWIPLRLPEQIRDRFCNSEVISLGGATEASIWSIYYPIKNINKDWKSIPYGYPLANQGFYVLNYEQKLCPIGVPGELYIGGKGLALEYKNDKEKTRTSFIEHPEYGRLYRTGDFGVLNEQGYIEFLGRKDSQVKIGGHRIELGEIENCLVSERTVKNAVVVDKTGANGQKYLVAYYVTDTVVEESNLRIHLSNQLPEYMIPQYFIEIDEVPLNTNGKVNRKLLPEPQIVEKARKIIEPENSTESCLLEIWKEILQIERISTDDNFLHIGGDSILMAAAVTKISNIFRIDITYREFMAARNIKNLAEIIDSKENRDEKIKYNSYSMDSEHLYDKFPLTDIQMAYLIGRNEEISLGGVSTHGYYEVETTLDIERLNAALNQIIKLQPMLRAIINAEGSQQILRITEPYVIEREDICYLSPEEREQRISRERERMSHHVFKTDCWPLFEIKAFLLEKTSYLFLSVDLLIMDGTSMGIFIRQWLDAYYGILKIRKPEFTFRDYVIALEEMQGSELYQRDKAFWNAKVEEFPSAPALPLKCQAEQIAHPHFLRKQKTINMGRWNKLKSVAKDKGITPSVLLATIYARVLGQWSNQQKFGLNVTIFNRYPFNPDVQDMIGDFTSVILLEVKLEEGENFWDLAEKIQANLLEALEHRHYDGVKVIRQLARYRNDNQQAIMPIVYTSMLSTDEKLGSISDIGRIKSGISQTSQVYLDYQVMETSEGLTITWDYVEELFDENIISSMFGQYNYLLELLLLNHELDEVKLPNEMESLWKAYNQTATVFEQITIPEKFLEIANRYPEKIAVKNGSSVITYKELNEKANQVANYLIEQQVKKNDYVGVIGKRTIDTIVNLLGVMKAGAAYVAIDPEYPEERRSYIINNSTCNIVLDEDTYQREKLDDYSVHLPAIKLNPDGVAYVIYTSGSTGKPKGVVITQRSVMNTLQDINQKFHVGIEDNIIGISSMCFDLSVYDIFGALISGATLIQIPDIRDVAHIRKIMDEEKITIWNSVPAIMDMVVSRVEANREDKAQFWEMNHEISIDLTGGCESSLRLVLLSGDWIPLTLPDKIKEVYDMPEIISLGGATEASIWSIYYPINKIDSKWKSIPYGMPLANQSIYVLDYAGNNCPVDVMGEIYIGGLGVACGYLNDKERSAEAFVNHPQYGKLYRTGDYGKMKNCGYIEFMGRKDFQVKINGHRIELGEIENCLMAFEQIDNAVVVDWEDENKSKYIAAYYVASKAITDHVLSSYLENFLPNYMIPRYFIKIQEIPLTTNGKVNRKKLPKPMDSAVLETVVAPKTPFERDIADIWKKVLKLNNETVSIHDDFFRIGGDSVSAIKVYTCLSEKYELVVNDVFKLRTIESLARALRLRKDDIIEKMKKEFLEKEILLTQKEGMVDKDYKEYESLMVKDLSTLKPERITLSDVLLTGATGFLGAYLLKELMTETKSNVYALVRGENLKTAEERLKENLSYYFGENFYSENSYRIHVICGNIAKENLGLKKQVYTDLANKITVIINSAANVSHFGTKEDLYDVNVKGVEKIIRFAKEGLKKHIYHMSTTTLASGQISNVPCRIFTEYDFDVEQKNLNIYARSKMEAERLLREAEKEGVLASVFRIGNISFQSDNGRYQKNVEKNAFYKMIQSYLKLGIIPESETKCVEISNVDYVSKAIVVLIQNYSVPNQTFHIQNPNKLSFNEFKELMNAAGTKLNSLPYLEFLDKLYELKRNPVYTKYVNSILNHNYLLPWHTRTVFTVLSERTQLVLRSVGFEWNIYDKKLFTHMLNFGRENGFLD